MHDNALVSIIIPTHFRNDLLRESLYSAISQTYKNIEIIVVDDSGVQFAAEAVREFDGVTYVPLEENEGPNVARNVGIRLSSGDYIQLLDDDDYLDEEKIERQVSVLDANPEVGVVYCGGRSESIGEFFPNKGARGDVLRLALQFELPSCVTSTMLIRRNIVEDVYPLPDVPGSDDTYWKIEFAQRCAFDYVNAPLVTKREPDIRRGESRGAVDGAWDILDKYAGLYDKFGDDVRRIAESKAIKREAQYSLRSSIYSITAVRLFYRSVSKHPNPDLGHYLLLLSSLFGRRGSAWLHLVYQKFQDVRKERGGS